MMLYEEGRFQLDDPISKFIPAFADLRVFAGGSTARWDSVPAEREITFRDLLTHTSGLTYGFMERNPVDALYRARGRRLQHRRRGPGVVVDRLATCRCCRSRARRWNYSVATDVLGYLVEVISGRPFDAFMREEILRPLGMVDTDFHVPPGQARALRRQLRPGRGRAARADRRSRHEPLPRAAQGVSGGGGLVSTAADYLRFCRFMLNRGRARRRAPARPQDGRADDHEPPHGRHGRHGHAALLGVRPMTASASGSASR